MTNEYDALRAEWYAACARWGITPNLAPDGTLNEPAAPVQDAA